MFERISRFVRSLIVDEDFIRNLIFKTVKENLKTNWDVQIVYQFDDRNLLILMETEEKIRDKIGVITDPYYGDERDEKRFNGYMQFNLTIIKNCISDSGYFESINDIKELVLREVRRCQQYDFLRESGGDALIHRVYDELCDCPPEDDILEVDAKAFVIYGINFDFNDIFARYLKKNDESGEICECKGII